MELKDVKIGKIRGGLFFEENLVFPERSRSWASQIKKELFRLYKEKKLKFEYLVGVDEEGNIQISRKSETRLAIVGTEKSISFESGITGFDERLYFENELSLIIEIMLKTMDIVSYRVMGFELFLPIPLLEKKGMNFIRENYLRAMFDKLALLGKDINLDKTSVAIGYKIGIIDHQLRIANSKDDKALVFRLDNRCGSPERYSFNYGKFIADTWRYYEQKFWPFIKEPVESDIIDKHFLSTGAKEE